MASDVYTKLVLTVIAVCLVLIAAQGFMRGAHGAEPSLASQRYQLTALGGLGIMLRLDQATGETWSMNIRGGLGGWKLVPEEPRMELETE